MLVNSCLKIRQGVRDRRFLGAGVCRYRQGRADRRSGDLTNAVYDGIIFNNPVGGFRNLERSPSGLAAPIRPRMTPSGTPNPKRPTARTPCPCGWRPSLWAAWVWRSIPIVLEPASKPCSCHSTRTRLQASRTSGRVLSGRYGFPKPIRLYAENSSVSFPQLREYTR